MASPAFQLVAILTLALLPPVYSISVLWIGWCLFSNVFVFCTVLMSSFFLSFWGKLQPMISEFRVPLMIFAGNSYTYYNDLPTIVSKLAEAAGEGYEFDSHLEVSPLSSEPFWYILITCDMLYSVCEVNIVPVELLIKVCVHISYFLFLVHQGGWSWEKHWNSNETLQKIGSKAWDVVVLQVSNDTSNV